MGHFESPDRLFELIITVQETLDKKPYRGIPAVFSEAGDVRAGAQGDVEIAADRSSRKLGIDMHDHGPAIVFGVEHPLEGNGAVFGGIAAHDKNGIGIFDVDPVIGHRTTSERLSQSRNILAVSDTRLVVEMDAPQRPDRLMDQRALLVVHVRSPQGEEIFQMVDLLSFAV